MDQFDINNIILKMACPNNELIYDDAGKPSVMVYIPKFKLSQVIEGGSDKVHPAFIVNGVERDGFYVSKYLNVDVDGKGYSLPAAIPQNNVGIELSREKSMSKGPGWHLLTVQEWGAIALWCKKNGHLPSGNTADGKEWHETIYKAIPVPSTVPDGKGRVLTGTGPLSWSHDNTAAGIFDLVGNLSEWVGGIRAVYGEIQVLPNNDAADRNNSQAPDSSAWRAIDATTGEYIVPDGKGTTPNSCKLDYWDEIPLRWSNKWLITTEIKNQVDNIRRADFHTLECDETISKEAREVLIALGLIPDNPEYYDYGDLYVYHNNGRDEVYMYRGCTYNTRIFSGLFVWSCSFGREQAIELQGFRASYIPLDE